MIYTTFNPETKIWSGGNLSSIFNPNISIGQAILWTLKRNPRYIGQISDNNGIRLTNEEIRMKTIRAAQNIIKLGFKEGDIIAVIAKNSHNLASIIFAAFSIGLPVNTLDPTFELVEIVHMLNITQPKLVFCDRDNLETVHKSLSELHLNVPVYTFDGATSNSQSVDELLVETYVEDTFEPVLVQDGANTTAVIVCSSGTTGLSKGVCLTHAQLLDRMTTIDDIGLEDVSLCFSSLYWLSGLATLLFSTLQGCTRIITTDSFKPELLLRLIEEYKITYILSPPSHLALTLKHEDIDKTDISSVRHYLCGGSTVAEELCMQMGKRLPNGNVYVGYGLSEIGGIVSFNKPPRSGSVGLLCGGVQTKIVDDDGKLCDIIETGELCLKVPYKFTGYYGNSEMTRNAFDTDGWFITGDIGYFDADGYLYIVDRKKDILKYCNYQISPSEIESILIKHPGIKQVCVVGVPDLVCTDLPAAVIVKQDDDIQLTEENIHKLAESQLSDFKKLRGGVYFVESLPMTPSGKVLKRIVKDMAVKLFKKRQTGQ